jgi:NAD(P)H-hydrate epimerase
MTSELPRLPRRDPEGHKGTFGTVCVIGGQAHAPRVMIGGPAFTASAALRSGAGLCILAVPAPIMAAALVIAPGATGLALPVDRDRALRSSAAAEILDAHLGSADCVAIGPGFGTGDAQQQIVVRLLAGSETPLVVDADALNTLAALRDFPGDLGAPAILTPHPGEFRRLAKALALGAEAESGATDPARRADAATRLAARLGCVVVLKGAGTVVSDGLGTWTCRAGCAALATAGTGDVLTGVIASFVAQFAREPAGLSLYDCARLGVEVHGRAGDRWASRHGDAGLVAQELIDEIPDVLRDLRAG